MRRFDFILHTDRGPQSVTRSEWFKRLQPSDLIFIRNDNFGSNLIVYGSKIEAPPEALRFCVECSHAEGVTEPGSPDSALTLSAGPTGFNIEYLDRLFEDRHKLTRLYVFRWLTDPDEQAEAVRIARQLSAEDHAYKKRGIFGFALRVIRKWLKWPEPAPAKYELSARSNICSEAWARVASRLGKKLTGGQIPSRVSPLELSAFVSIHCEVNGLPGLIAEARYIKP